MSCPTWARSKICKSLMHWHLPCISFWLRFAADPLKPRILLPAPAFGPAFFLRSAENFLHKLEYLGEYLVLSRVTHEEIRLEEARTRKAHWQRWGPYLAERAWGTVREDYSPYGNAWEFLPHD